LNLDPIPFDCPKCKKETTHSVRFAQKTQAAGTLSATCSVCGSPSVTLPMAEKNLVESIRKLSAMGSYKRKIVKPNP
jgi:transcription elongation factor Elf1